MAEEYSKMKAVMKNPGHLMFIYILISTPGMKGIFGTSFTTEERSHSRVIDRFLA